jgi:hypothetical protein
MGLNRILCYTNNDIKIYTQFDYTKVASKVYQASIYKVCFIRDEYIAIYV